MNRPHAPSLHVACLCAAWCRLCGDYRAVFEQAMASLREAHPGLHTHWIDIEDEADLLGELDIETFPTIVVADPQHVRFAGPLTPQPETLLRLLRTVLAPDASVTCSAPSEVEAFAARLRLLPAAD